WWWLVLAGVPWAASCESQVSVCVPGRQVSCACPGGLEGVQTCNDDEMFDDCECDFPVGAATTSGSGAGASSTGAGASSGSGAGGGGGGGTGGASGVTLSAGDEVLVDVFVGDAGIYLVF